MRILTQDYKKGIVKIEVTQPEDLWHLSQIIDESDLITATTTRKIKIGNAENAKVAKKIMIVTIQTETIDFGSEHNTLRINGKIKEGPDDIPKESYQAIELEVGTIFTLQKETWLSYQKQKIQEATKPKEEHLICILDREEAIFAQTSGSRQHILTTLSGDVPKKAMVVDIKKDFHEQIIEILTLYANRLNPSAIIIASPAFYKEDLLKKIHDPQLKKKITLATCSDVSSAALSEIMRRPELQSVLKSTRARIEQQQVDELLYQINAQNKACYGLPEVTLASQTGAINTLLITDQFIKNKKQANTFLIIDQIMKQVETSQGQIYILSIENQAGKTLQGLGGIAVLLRYKLNSLHP